MRQIKEEIYSRLNARQQQFGGYTGKEIRKIARIFGFDRRTLKRNLEKWSKTDPFFAELKYIGKHSIPMALEDTAILNKRFSENITYKKQDLIREINDNRIKREEIPLPRSTLYRIINNFKETLTKSRPQELHWLSVQGIEVTDTYNLVDARATLSNIFTYNELKTFGGIDLESIALRLDKARNWFNQTYLNVDPFKWFPRVRSRSKVLRNHLSRIKDEKTLSSQARLVFEVQVDFIVDLNDIFIDELIHKMDWIQQSMNDSRQNIENETRTRWINQYYDMGEKVIENPNGENLAKLKEIIDRGKPESEEAELDLMKHHKRDYEKIYEHLEKLTNKFSENETIPHHVTAQIVLDLCRDNSKWAFLTEEEKKKLTKNRLIQSLKDPKQILNVILTKKLINYIKKGKIILIHSFKYQDIGKIIESVELSDDNWMVTREDIEKLIDGTYAINFETEIHQNHYFDEKEESDYQPYNKIPFQQVQNQVAGLVADHSPQWFQSHQEIFRTMTDGMFEMEHDELTFRTKLYDAIGFLGRNLRYSDSPAFYSLQYFIQHYLSDATLDLEFRHLWKVYESLTGHKTSIIIIDSMGIDSRRKSLFAKVHGRYHTIGFADLRAISLFLIPVFSSNCRSTDSEAMNIVEIVNHAKSVLGEEFKFCAGNAHTVSRVAAGLAFADHKVILLGRDPNPPNKPGKICLSRLLKHLALINKVGKLIREDGEFGRIIASREHIFADGVDVRNLLRDLGKLILWNCEQKGYDLDDLIQNVETSNRQKRVVRIVERGVTRVTEPNVSLVLKSAELILLMSGIANILNSRGSLKWKGMSPISMDNIALFIPA